LHHQVGTHHVRPPIESSADGTSSPSLTGCCDSSGSPNGLVSVTASLCRNDTVAS
jgi:hypothetical protein